MKPRGGTIPRNGTPPSRPPAAPASNSLPDREPLEPHHRLVAWPAHWPRQQLHNVPLQIVVRGKADRVLDLPFFQRLVQLRLGKGSVGAEDYLLAQPLLAFNLRKQQFLPALGTVDVARP